MEKQKPWFKLDPNNEKDPWWLYTSIVDTNIAQREQFDADILCYFIMKDYDTRGEFYRASIWYKNDPNRYTSIYTDYNWLFNKKFIDMKEGDVVCTYSKKFNVYNCKFSNEKVCKILESID